MASQTNHNADYLYVVDGITPWERLRVIRNFIEQHEQNLAMAYISQEETVYKISKIEDPIEKDFAERKAEVSKAQSEDAIQKCKNEIEFLKELEKGLVTETDPTRIEGKSDEEMYEINYFNELSTRIVREAHCDLISTGRVSPNVIQKILKCPPALRLLSGQNVLNSDEILALTGEDQKILEESYEKLLSYS